MVRRAVKQSFSPSPRLDRIRALAAARSDVLIEREFKVPDDATGVAVDFNMRWAQRRAYDIYHEERAKEKPIRLWFLKSRRVGLTSLFAADDLIDAWSQPNRHVGVIAHNEFRSREILDMCKFFYKHMRASLKVPLSRDAMSGIRFLDNDSGIMIGTCNEPEKVRGGGLHRAHLSEPAFYGRMFKKVMLEIAATIAPAPRTCIILETTGKGRGSACHSHWLASRAGETIYRAEFLPWQEDPTCQIPFDSDYHKDVILGEMAEVEPRLVDKFKFYKLTPEQMHWAYRNAYIYRCEQDYERFCREFPMDEEEAWDASGISFFGDNEIAIMSTRIINPVLFSFGGRFINRIFQRFTDLQRINRMDDASGNLIIKVWAMPEPGRRYVVGSDVSLGEKGGAYSAGYIIDLQTRQMMCSYRGRIRPDEHAYVMASLGTMYNTAIVAPEVNPGGGGMQVLNDLQRLGYNNIYIWRLRDDKRGIILTRRLGMVTNMTTRPLMLNELRKVFVDAARDRFADPGLFPDKTLLSEMRTFQKDPENGRIEASEDAYDDTIFGLAIAHLVAADEVYGCGGYDIYGGYGKVDEGKQPFADLLQHYEDIHTLPDPTEAIQFLMDTNFELKEGRTIWQE